MVLGTVKLMNRSYLHGSFYHINKSLTQKKSTQYFLLLLTSKTLLNGHMPACTKPCGPELMLESQLVSENLVLVPPKSCKTVARILEEFCPLNYM